MEDEIDLWFQVALTENSDDADAEINNHRVQWAILHVGGVSPRDLAAPVRPADNYRHHVSGDS